jgi:hypothetical protein
MNSKNIIGVLVVSGLLASGTVALAAANENARGCGTTALIPTKSGVYVKGHANRHGCSNSVTLTTKIVVKSTPWDRDLGVVSLSGVVNGDGTASYRGDKGCNSWNFYSVGETNTGEYQSSATKKFTWVTATSEVE